MEASQPVDENESRRQQVQVGESSQTWFLQHFQKQPQLTKSTEQVIRRKKHNQQEIC